MCLVHFIQSFILVCPEKLFQNLRFNGNKTWLTSNECLFGAYKNYNAHLDK